MAADNRCRGLFGAPGFMKMGVMLFAKKVVQAGAYYLETDNKKQKEFNQG
ncbi:MAG TPA: hypothetical protein VJ844_06810 [Mucilaginibacter sp.]|nr:hypothetical protein [Mucilaginibacter sp.]